MKKIGIVGGLSPESTASYYLHICRRYTQIYGDVGFPEIAIYSVCLEKYHMWRDQGRWDLIINDLVKAIDYLDKTDVEFCIIATNTMHKVIKEVQARVRLPIISIIDATMEMIHESGLSKVGLLGTKFTMRDGFFINELENNGISVVTPDDDGVSLIHSVIEKELVRGVVSPVSRAKVIAEIEKLAAVGAAGIILGCTELPLLIRQEDCKVAIFDTAIIHAEKALDFCTGKAIKNSL